MICIKHYKNQECGTYDLWDMMAMTQFGGWKVKRVKTKTFFETDWRDAWYLLIWLRIRLVVNQWMRKPSLPFLCPLKCCLVVHVLCEGCCCRTLMKKRFQVELLLLSYHWHEMLWNWPSMASINGNIGWRDLQNINLMCYIHAKREELCQRKHISSF